jgi:transposase
MRTSMAELATPVTAGVDTHAEFHVAAVVDGVGRPLGTERFAANTKGYKAFLGWAQRFGPLAQVAVEGTGSYGAGLARYLGAEDVKVVEVVRPNRQARRRRGKSDVTDALAAALAALSGEAAGAPKAATGAAEALRVLQVARQGAIKARTQASNELRDLVVTAPEELRARLAGLDRDAQVERAARFRPKQLTGALEATKAAMAYVARRHRALTAEIGRLDQALADIVADAAPERFLAKQGVGPVVATTLLRTVGDNPGRVRTEAAFAAMCGVSPVDASSGKHARHRLNRGGDRQANSALWRVVMTRITHDDPRTMAYVERRTKEGKSRKEIVRCLKRYVARELYKALVKPSAAARLTTRMAPDEAA